MLKETHMFITQIACEFLNNSAYCEQLKTLDTELMKKLSWEPDEWSDLKIDGPGILDINVASLLHFKSGYQMRSDFSLPLSLIGAETIIPFAKIAKILVAEDLKPLVKEGYLFDVDFPSSPEIMRYLIYTKASIERQLSFALHCAQDAHIPHHVNNALLAKHQNFEKSLNQFIIKANLKLHHFYPRRCDYTYQKSGMIELDQPIIFFTSLLNAFWSTVGILSAFRDSDSIPPDCV